MRDRWAALQQQQRVAAILIAVIAVLLMIVVLYIVLSGDDASEAGLSGATPTLEPVPTATTEPTITIPPTNTAPPTNTPRPTNTPQATNTLPPTETPVSAETPMPTETPAPTGTPEPIGGATQTAAVHTPTPTTQSSGLPPSTSTPVSPTPTATATSTPTLAPTSTPTLVPSPQATPEPTAEPISVAGAGTQQSSAVELRRGLTVLTVRHEGEGEFSVAMVNQESGESVAVIAENMGNWSGTRAIRLGQEAPYVFDVDAAGMWAIEIEQPTPMISEVFQPPHDIEGEGTEVAYFHAFEPGGRTISVSFDGDGPFVVEAFVYGTNRVETLIDQNGPVDSATAELEIQGDQNLVLFAVQAEGGIWRIQSQSESSVTTVTTATRQSS